MCRLFIANQKALKLYEEKGHGLGKLLAHLEKECGGHGNGVTLIREGQVVEYVKGVQVTTDEIERVLFKHCYDYAIFHTRIASVGSVDNERCHPFIWGDDVLAMNGTVHGLSRTAQATGVTDTEIAFDLVKGRPFSYVMKVLQSLDAVFVGVAEGGKPYAIKNGGALKEWISGDSTGFMFASSFPPSTPNVSTLPYDFIFTDGKRSHPSQEKDEREGKNGGGSGRLKSMHRARFYTEEDYAYPFVPDDGLAPFLMAHGGYDDWENDDEEEDEEAMLSAAYYEGYSAGYKDGLEDSKGREGGFLHE